MFFLSFPFIFGKKYPGYSNLKDIIIKLGSKDSPVNLFFAFNLILVGILLLIFAIAQNRFFFFKNWATILYTSGIIIFVISTILAGIFPEDPKGYQETIKGKIYGIA
ncbi:MAG: DUF998 domain-containing protein [Spirochaetes bacterium]|nr:DUF998 domain-containing protein [Spirochaetota bacterium]